MELILVLVGIILALAAYFLPYIVADQRGRDGCMMILVLNVLLGWTVLGWVVLLIIAFTGESAATRNARHEELALLRKMAASAPRDPA